MNTSTLIIDEEYIKENSTVSDNLSDKLIKPSIIDAQISGLMPLIGEVLYDKICSMIDTSSIEPVYNQLVNNYIKHYLLYQTIANMTINNFQKQHNAGSVQYVDTNYSNIQLRELQYIETHWNNKAAFYAKRLTDYLIANNNIFPEYKTCETGKMKSNEKTITSYIGISL